jgi:hypothetical protein
MSIIRRATLLFFIAMTIHWLCVTSIPISSVNHCKGQVNECNLCVTTAKKARAYEPLSACLTDRCMNITHTVAQLALDRSFVNYTEGELCEVYRYCKIGEEWTMTAPEAIGCF